MVRIHAGQPVPPAKCIPLSKSLKPSLSIIRHSQSVRPTSASPMDGTRIGSYPTLLCLLFKNRLRPSLQSCGSPANWRRWASAMKLPADSLVTLLPLPRQTGAAGILFPLEIRRSVDYIIRA